MYIEWDEALNTGVDVIDAQHRRLIAHINELYASIGAGQGEQALDRLLWEFGRYADEHFGTEERLLKKHAPDAALAAGHLAAHEDYRRRMEAFRQRRVANERLVPIEILAMVGQWWLRHIAREDRIYATLAAGAPPPRPADRHRAAR